MNRILKWPLKYSWLHHFTAETAVQQTGSSHVQTIPECETVTSSSALSDGEINPPWGDMDIAKKC